MSVKVSWDTLSTLIALLHGYLKDSTNLCTRKDLFALIPFLDPRQRQLYSEQKILRMTLIVLQILPMKSLLLEDVKEFVSSKRTMENIRSIQVTWERHTQTRNGLIDASSSSVSPDWAEFTTGCLTGSTIGIEQDKDRYQETLITDHEVTVKANSATAIVRCHTKRIVRDTIQPQRKILHWTWQQRSSITGNFSLYIMTRNKLAHSRTRLTYQEDPTNASHRENWTKTKSYVEDDS